MLTLSRTDGIQKLLQKTTEEPHHNHRYRKKLPQGAETIEIKGFDRTLRPKDQAFYLRHGDSKNPSPILYHGQSEQYFTSQESSRYVFAYNHAFDSTDVVNITGLDHTLRPEHQSFYLNHMEANISSSVLYNGVHKHDFKQYTTGL